MSLRKPGDAPTEFLQEMINLRTDAGYSSATSFGAAFNCASWNGIERGENNNVAAHAEAAIRVVVPGAETDVEVGNARDALRGLKGYDCHVDEALKRNADRAGTENINFSDLLVVFRTYRRMEQGDVANLLGIARGSYQNFENPERKTTLSEANDVVRKLGFNDVHDFYQQISPQHQEYSEMVPKFREALYSWRHIGGSERGDSGELLPNVSQQAFARQLFDIAGIHKKNDPTAPIDNSTVSTIETGKSNTSLSFVDGALQVFQQMYYQGEIDIPNEIAIAGGLSQLPASQTPLTLQGFIKIAEEMREREPRLVSSGVAPPSPAGQLFGERARAIREVALDDLSRKDAMGLFNANQGDVNKPKKPKKPSFLQTIEDGERKSAPKKDEMRDIFKAYGMKDADEFKRFARAIILVDEVNQRHFVQAASTLLEQQGGFSTKFSKETKIGHDYISGKRHPTLSIIERVAEELVNPVKGIIRRVNSEGPKGEKERDFTSLAGVVRNVSSKPRIGSPVIEFYTAAGIMKDGVIKIDVEGGSVSVTEEHFKLVEEYRARMMEKHAWIFAGGKGR